MRVQLLEENINDDGKVCTRRTKSLEDCHAISKWQPPGRVEGCKSSATSVCHNLRGIVQRASHSARAFSTFTLPV